MVSTLACGASYLSSILGIRPIVTLSSNGRTIPFEGMYLGLSLGGVTINVSMVEW